MSTRFRNRMKGILGRSRASSSVTGFATDPPDIDPPPVYELPGDMPVIDPGRSPVGSDLTGSAIDLPEIDQPVEERQPVCELAADRTYAYWSHTRQSDIGTYEYWRGRGDERHDNVSETCFVPHNVIEPDVSDAINIYDAVPLSLPSSFRLLEIVPGDLEVVSCRLYAADLRDSPKYTALSYTWGSPHVVDTIMVNGELFKVRKNLRSFLSEARSGRHPDLGPLWIDAICIEQASVPERNHQVSVMGEIYAKAAIVISWLGYDTPRLSHAIWWLHDRAQGLTTYVEDASEPLNTVNALRALCNHDYWTRLWIIQEVVLARDVQVWCGGHQFPLHLLYAATKNRPTLWKRITYIRVGDITTPANRVLERRYHPNHSYDSILSIGEGTTEADKIKAPRGEDDNDLCSLLQVTCLANCEDPRDGIFGILSILALDEKRLLDIQPDYSKDRETIVLDVVDKIWIRLAKCDTQEYHRYIYWIFKALKLPHVHLFYQLYSPATAMGEDRKKYYDMWKTKQAEEVIGTREKVDLSLMGASIDLD